MWNTFHCGVSCSRFCLMCKLIETFEWKPLVFWLGRVFPPVCWCSLIKKKPHRLWTSIICLVVHFLGVGSLLWLLFQTHSKPNWAQIKLVQPYTLVILPLHARVSTMWFWNIHTYVNHTNGSNTFPELHKQEWWQKREVYEASSPLRTTQAFYDSVESITGNIRINSNRQEQGINIK